MSSSSQVGSVTVEEITDALKTGGGILSHQVFYQRLSQLHLSKIGKCTMTQLLDDMARTRNLLEGCNIKHRLPMKWMVHLYDTMIKTGILLTTIKQRTKEEGNGKDKDKDKDPEVEEMIIKLKSGIETSWKQMNETM